MGSLKMQGRARRKLRGVATTILVAGVLAGCDDQGKFALPSLGANSATASAPAPAGPTVERDIEAPEVFSVTDEGLWDGRPSLGGVWVAHPDVTDPERVIIRNQANGQFVVGALFRRERDIPGPSLQISSDAAASLGILAGAPTKLNVTALRKVEEPTEAAAPQPGPSVEPAPEVSATPLPPAAASTAQPQRQQRRSQNRPPHRHQSRPYKAQACPNPLSRSVFSASKKTQSARPSKCAALDCLLRSRKVPSAARRSGVWLLAPPPPARNAPRFCRPSKQKALPMPMLFPANS